MTLVPPSSGASPKWGPTTKTVIGLTFAAIIASLLIYFRAYIGPLILAFVLTYLFHPVAAYLNRVTKFSWRAIVTIIYLLLFVLIIAGFTLAGVVIVQQIQSLIEVINRFVNDLPQIVTDLTAQRFMLGPFEIDLSRYDLTSLAQQVINILQPVLGRLTGVLGAIAAGALTVIVWTLFTLLISYFLLAGAGRVPDLVDYIQVPGYDSDIRRMGFELGRIWNAFLRGQLILTVLIILAYTVLMTILGVRFALGIAVLAGTARFVPYVGPLATWAVTALVAFFQGHNYFGLDSMNFTVLVIIAALVLDQVFDNFVSPQIFSQTLRLHPAGVLLAALVAANLLGIIGLIVAAPVLASINLLARYAIRKMLDLDPWLELQTGAPASPTWSERLLRRLRAWWRAVRQNVRV